MHKLLMMFLSALLIGGPVAAQITIQTNDFQPPVGTILQFSQAGGVTEDVFNTMTSGTGGGHTWDFSALFFNAPYGGLVVDKASAPASDSFPNANIVINYPYTSDTSWKYLRSVSTSFEDLGSVIHTTFGETITKYDPAGTEYQFPMQYGDSWTLIRMLHSETTPQLYTDTYDTTFYNVDAYGTASYKGNSFPCLRISSIKRVTVTTVANGIPINTYTTTTEMVDFAAAGFDVLVTIGRTIYTGGTTYFGSGSGTFYNTPTGIVDTDPGSLPDGFGLDQNYPNPFNPNTDIRFSLPTAANARLEIFNVLGQRTKTLVNQGLPAGSYSVNWDGTNESGSPVASGIYFYRFETEGFSASKKMLLLK
jgi:hypothetical protein